MMKKFAALLLTLLMAVSLISCGSNPSQTTDPQQQGGAPSTTGAADFPKGNVTWIIPLAAGSNGDVHGRKLAAIVERYLGTTIVVENIAGGNMATGTTQMLGRNPDGYTICQASPTLSTLLNSDDAPFKMEDFRYLCAFNAEPNGFTVRSDSGWNSLEEVIEWAKANPGKLIASGSGSGGVQHLTLQLLANQAGFEYTYIPYDGGKEAVLALLGENCNAIGVTPSNCQSNYESGELKLLGVSGSERMSRYADAQAYSELGYDIPIVNWRGMVCSAKVPDDVFAVLEQAFMDAIQDPEWVAFNEEQGQLDGYFANSEEFEQLVADTNEAFLTAAASLD